MTREQELELENAKLRGQVEELRRLVETLVTRPAPQFIPVPAPMPTVNPPAIVPYVPYIPTPNDWWAANPKIVCAGVGNGATVPLIVDAVLPGVDPATCTVTMLPYTYNAGSPLS